MADGSLDQLVEDALRRVGGGSSSESVGTALGDAAREIEGLRAANRTLAEVVESNTRAVTRGSAGESGNVAKTIASTVFGAGLGLSPLVSAIAGLFRGGESKAPAPLIQYPAPGPLRLDLANTTEGNTGVGGFAPVSYGQDGLARVARASAPVGTAATVAGPQISIQVNALDSRSFMDHSHEIAQAVRQAMLNSHSLNDVISDL